MRQKIRKTLLFVSLLLFPLTLNYLSPYVSIDGAMAGVLSGSALLFLLQFVSGLFLGRAWCGWVCPAGGVGEFCQSVNNKPVNIKRLRIVRYSVFAVWFAVLALGFVLAGGIKGVDPLRMTTHGVSVDMPVKFVIYYFVVALILVLDLSLGRRGACHAVCWMAPFLTAGLWLGRKLHLPQLQMRADAEKCIDCKACNKKCPMRIDVYGEARLGGVRSYECILCGECADFCPKGVLSYKKRK